MNGLARPDGSGLAAVRSGPVAMGLFRDRFGHDPEGLWFAPGRANLMGEHTDYNQGFVLPFALAQGTAAAAARRSDRIFAVCSRQAMGHELVIPLDDLVPGAITGWSAYPAGVAWALRQAGYELPGVSIAISSDVAAGAGVSSSAALECVVALALTSLAGIDIARPELAAIGRRAENEFVGVPSGIMDQSASLLGQADHALLLDCESQESSQVPFNPAVASVRLLIVNTRAAHQHSAGGYGQRRSECERAARLLSVSSLRYLTNDGEISGLTDPVLRRRVRHVCSDNQRTLQAASLLRSAPAVPARPGKEVLDVYRQVGALLSSAHVSLRDDFEISWPEADVAVEAAVAAGALGARMVGGGFGGSVLALVPTDGDTVRGAIASAFAARSWAAPEFIDAVPSAGARRLT